MRACGSIVYILYLLSKGLVRGVIHSLSPTMRMRVIFTIERGKGLHSRSGMSESLRPHPLLEGLGVVCPQNYEKILVDGYYIQRVSRPWNYVDRILRQNITFIRIFANLLH